MANLKDLIVNGSARILGTLYAPDMRNTNRITEFIVGTQASSTGSWTGVTKDDSLYDGKNINYFLPYAGSGNASLNLTLSNGTTTGAKPVYLWGTSYVTTHYPVNSCINMTYNATKGAWFVNADRDNNDNTYDRIKVPNAIKASATCTNGKLIVGTSAGYKDIASDVTFDISYPILYCGTAITSGSTGTNNYLEMPSVNLQTTKASWTGTQYSVVYLVGTLSGKTFTIDSSVFTTTVPSSEDGKVYMPIGILYSTYQIYFAPSSDLYAYFNGSFQPLQPDVDIDNTTITKNASSKLQTVAVKDNRSGNAIKTWTGTKAQYDAITTKDANTLYNITDDTDVTLTLLNLLYPVGSLYIASGNLSTCPLSVLGVGTWSLKTTTTLVTGVNSTAPVVGNGITLGLTNGTINFGSYKSSNSQYPRYCLAPRDYGKAIGVSAPDNTATVGNDITIGVTTDPDKSGIEANITSTTLAVTIWERIS